MPLNAPWLFISSTKVESFIRNLYFIIQRGTAPTNDERSPGMSPFTQWPDCPAAACLIMKAGGESHLHVLLRWVILLRWSTWPMLKLGSRFKLSEGMVAYSKYFSYFCRSLCLFGLNTLQCRFLALQFLERIFVMSLSVHTKQSRPWSTTKAHLFSMCTGVELNIRSRALIHSKPMWVNNRNMSSHTAQVLRT